VQFGNCKLRVRNVLQYGVAIDCRDRITSEGQVLDVGDDIDAFDLQEIDVEKSGRSYAACTAYKQLYTFAIWQ
jgi:hypothetical protein